MQTLQEVLEWYSSVEGVLEDEIAWNKGYKPFNDKKQVKLFFQGVKADQGINYEIGTLRDFFEGLQNYLKSFLRRKITDTREDLYGKTLNTTSSKKKRPKLNNPNEFASNK